VRKGSDLDYVVRFVAGGLIVSLFAVLGDVLRPKSFAGLFGAAPSVALATLTLTIAKKGPSYVATEAQSMLVGAVAFMVFACLVCQLLMRLRASALTATTTMLVAWIAVAFGLKQLLIG
jgi:hypothetical protein